MATTCPRDGTELTELERSGVRIDACRTCRGVWLDRGELEKLLERESQHLDRRDEEDEAFLREVTGRGGERRPDGDRDQRRQSESERGGGQLGFDRRTAERIFDEYRTYKGGHGSSHGKRRKKSILDELLG